MSAPMEQNGGGGDGTGDAALLNSTRKRKGDKISLDCNEETGMLSKGVQAKLPICNEGWFYERLIGYYNHKRMMRKAANYIEERRTTRSEIKRLELDKRYHEQEQINKETEQATEKVNTLRKKWETSENSDSKQEISDKPEINEKEEREVSNEKLGNEEFTVKLE